MAYGDMMVQPGYRSPTQSMIPDYRGPTGAGRYGPPTRGSALSGGGGFPNYRSAATPRTGIPSLGAGGVGGSAVNTQINVPGAQPYSPFTGTDPNLAYMANYAKGLMDPDSELYRRMSAGMQQQIGGQTAAQQRAARLRAMQSGFGAGGAEMMATTADLGQAGLEAQGMAEANLRMQAPQIGAGMLQSTFQPGLGYAQLGEGSRQYGAGLGEGARQYGGNLALGQQQIAAQQAMHQSSMQHQANLEMQRLNWERERAQWEAMQRQMAQQYA